MDNTNHYPTNEKIARGSLGTLLSAAAADCERAEYERIMSMDTAGLPPPTDSERARFQAIPDRYFGEASAPLDG